MSFDAAEFSARYEQWAKESLSDYQAGTVERIRKTYPYVISTDVPWTPCEGNISDKTIALITSGGLYLKDSQPPFVTGEIHGDPSFRELPRDVHQDDFGIAHNHYDHSLVMEDINTIFPIDRLLELERDGIVGTVASRHYTFSYVNDVVPLISTSIPEVIGRLRDDGVDILFLVPV